ncbi:unnamed protein product [Linum trigynum]|uniref:Zinc knuckle CX2CX4HX4C domain-containing protein n=1 Tax=Linum trigynum TaxID=586398 RepID=A0AAV2GV80_9ROSI
MAPNRPTAGGIISSSSRGRGSHPILTSTGGRGISMILGKMLTENKVAVAKAAGAARYAWGSYGEVNIQPTETPNLFIFTFNKTAIRDKVWMDRPWSLSNTLTAIEKYSGRGKPKDVPIVKVAMWVQIHGLHHNQRNERNMEAIGSSYFLELFDLDRASLDYAGYRRFRRILVEVDLREPVPTGFDFPFLDETTGIDYCDEITFKYERLVELCYFCGRIGHNWPTCWRMNEERKKNGVAHLSEIYNSSLKAGIDSPHRPSSTNFRVSGESKGKHSSMGEREGSRSGGGYRRGEEGAGGSAEEIGNQSERSHRVPPGFTIPRIENHQSQKEAQAKQGRLKGRFRVEMGARNLASDMDRGWKRVTRSNVVKRRRWKLPLPLGRVNRRHQGCSLVKLARSL